MTRMSFDEARREIASLLETGKEEIDSGNELVALSLLLEAQGVFNEMFQNEMEKARGLVAVEPDWPNNIDLKRLH